MRDERGRAGIRLLVAAAVVLGAMPLLSGPSVAETYSNPTPIVLTYKTGPPGCPGPNGCRGDQADPYPSTIAVAGTSGLITDVNVTLNEFSHVRPSDVDVLLQAPDGRTVILMSDACSAAGAFDPDDPLTTPVDLTFDDEAAAPLPADTTCTSGTYLPVDDDNDANEVPIFIAPADGFPVPGTCTAEPPVPCGPEVPQTNSTLSGLEGMQADGNWNLYVVNDGPGDCCDVRGQFAGGWSLDITTTGSTPTSTTMGPTTTTTTAPGGGGATEVCNTTPLLGTEGGTSPEPLTPYPSTITIEGRTGTVADVNVTLRGFTSQFPEDIDMMLTAPDNTTNIVLVSDAGGNDSQARPVEDVDLTLDDQAATPLPADTQITSGTYQPIDDNDDEFDYPDAYPAPAPTPSGSTSLSTFNGIDPNGTWNLYVVDDYEQGISDFSGGWCLEITTTEPPGGLVVDIDDTVVTDGTRGQVRGTITCEAGQKFVVELDDLTQGSSMASGTARGTCTGSPQRFVIGFTTTGPSFTDGTGEACVTARTGPSGSRSVTDSTEACEDVTIDVRSR